MKTILTILLTIICALDSISQQNNIGGIINNYTPVIRLEKCDNEIIVEDASFIKPNDTILIIQMKGAIVDISNSAKFGDITNYGSSGYYEINFVKSIIGTRIKLKNAITNSYNFNIGKVQLVRVPYFKNVTINSTLTCAPWDGSKGGILIFFAENSITLNANINVTGKGFVGGQVKNTYLNYTNCFQNEFYYPSQSILAAPKGESIALLPADKLNGKGKNAGGGGGGLDHNSGGGGGGGGGKGGLGGYQLYECNNSIFDNRGLGGIGLSPNTNRLFLGSGGGAGNCNNGFYNYAANTDFNGGNGGGIIIIKSQNFEANGYSIVSKGDSAYELNSNLVEAHDGMGGGGAGGSIFLDIQNYIGNINVDVEGGKGGDMRAPIVYGKIGPGGGGGGGVIGISSSVKPSQLISKINGGINGVQLLNNQDPYGATPGNIGIELLNLSLKIDTVPFIKIIDSIKIDTSIIGCNAYLFNAISYPYSSSKINYLWDFGDSTTSTQQTITKKFSTQGNYAIKLIATDSLSCSDTSQIIISAKNVNLTIEPVVLICKNKQFTVKANAINIDSFSWHPATIVQDSKALNTTAIINAPTTLYAIGKNSNCSAIDSLKLIPYNPKFSISTNQKICENFNAQLFALGGNTYYWTPSIFLSNPVISNPTAHNSQTQLFSVFITDTTCNDTTTLFTTVEIINNPILILSKSNDIDCSHDQAELFIQSNAQNLSWANSIALPNSRKITVTPIVSTIYSVTATNQFGCTKKDSILVLVTTNNESSYLIPNAFSPNNDGINDCFGIKYFGNVSSFKLAIYNRWGEKVYEFRNTKDCWNGYYKGILQPIGNYVYYLKAVTSCGNIEKKGNIILFN